MNYIKSSVNLTTGTIEEKREEIKKQFLQTYEIEEKLFDLLKETCEFLGIHPSTLNKWKAQNKIPYKRLGKRIFFERKGIQAALKESKYSKIHQLIHN